MGLYSFTKIDILEPESNTDFCAINLFTLVLARFPLGNKALWRSVLSVRPSDVTGTSQIKHPITSQRNVAKTSHWYIFTTSYWYVVTTSHGDAMMTSHQWVSTTSQTSLKWNTQRRLSGTLPRRPGGTYPQHPISSLYDVFCNSQTKHPITSLQNVSTASRSYVVATPCL